MKRFHIGVLFVQHIKVKFIWAMKPGSFNLTQSMTILNRKFITTFEQVFTDSGKQMQLWRG